MRKYKNYHWKRSNYNKKVKNEHKLKANDNFKMKIYTTHSYDNKLSINLEHLKQIFKLKK